MSRIRKLNLPDEVHFIQLIDCDRYVMLTVIRHSDLERKETFTAFKDRERWNDLVHAFCELARKKYPKQLRHKSVSTARMRIGL